MKRQWRQEFDIDGRYYVVSFVKNEFIFYLDVQKSKKKPPPDPDIGFSFYDESPRYIYSEVPVERPFEVKRKILEFVDNVLTVEEPYYFYFTGFFENKSRVLVYNKISERLANKYGYYYYIEYPKEDGCFFKFNFYKN